MEQLPHTMEEERPSTLLSQAASFAAHTLLALLVWAVLMLAGYALNPVNASQWLILALSLTLPFPVGFLINRRSQQEMAATIWLAGVIWTLIVCLWILDLPTGPNACAQCTAADKLARSLFSFPTPSGLLDDNAPFLATWPAAAMIGYSIGARLAMRKTQESLG